MSAIFRVLLAIAATAGLLGTASAVSAQAQPGASAATSTRQVRVSIPLACTTEGNGVDIVVSDSPAIALQGGEFTAAGAIRNSGKALLADGSLVARIEKLPENVGSLYERSFDAVDRFVVEDGLWVPSGSSTPFSLSWAVPNGVAPGKYRASLFLTSSDRFLIAGSEHGDGSLAAQVVFEVRGSEKTVSFIDFPSVAVNGKKLFVNRFSRVASSSPAEISLALLNTHTSERKASLEWRVYSSEVIAEENLVASKADTVVLGVDKKTVVSYLIPSVDLPVYHVVARLVDGTKSSIYSFRVVQSGKAPADVLSLGIDSFPVVQGEPNRVSACVEGGEGKTIELSLVRPDGSLEASLGTTSLGAAYTAVSRRFTPSANAAGPLFLKAQIKGTGDAIEDEAIVEYSCHALGCASDGEGRSFGAAYYYALVAAAVAVVIAASVSSIRKKGSTPPPVPPARIS